MQGRLPVSSSLFRRMSLAWIEKGIHYYAPAKFLIEGAVERMHSGQ